MLIKDLIIKLQAYPNQEALVVTNGYEGGYCDVDSFDSIFLELDVHDSWYYGPHEKVDDGENGVPAINLC